MSNQTYKKTGGSATVYVVRDKASRLTQLKIYFNTEGKGPVVLKNRVTSKSRILKNMRVRKADYQSVMTFKHLTNYVPKSNPEFNDKKDSKDRDKDRRFDYFDYILPGLNHNVTIVTPEGVKITILRKINSSPPPIEKENIDYDIGRVTLKKNN